MALTFGGMTAALGGLHHLRRTACPRCESAGTLVTVHQMVEGTPGAWPVCRRLRHCRQCRARVVDVRELRSRAPRSAIGRRLLSVLSS